MPNALRACWRWPNVRTDNPGPCGCRVENLSAPTENPETHKTDPENPLATGVTGRLITVRQSVMLRISESDPFELLIKNQIFFIKQWRYKEASIRCPIRLSSMAEVRRRATNMQCIVYRPCSLTSPSGSELIGAPSHGGSTGHAGKIALSNHGGTRLKSSASLEHSLCNTLPCVDLVRRQLRLKTRSHILQNFPSTQGIRDLLFQRARFRRPTYGRRCYVVSPFNAPDGSSMLGTL